MSGFLRGADLCLLAEDERWPLGGCRIVGALRTFLRVADVYGIRVDPGSDGCYFGLKERSPTGSG